MKTTWKAALSLSLALPLLGALSGCATGMDPQAMGTRPSYLASTTDDVPNAAALSHRIWTPGLDDGFVPQGLASDGRYLYVSSYKPTPDLKANTGPCRVFRIDQATGAAAGGFDIPPGTCTHSGGLAHVGDGRLFLADTRQLFLVDLDKALASGTSAGATRAIRISGDLRGSYATFDGKDAWIGTWTKDEPKARMFRLDLALFDRLDGQSMDHAQASESIPVPLEAQGAAFDRQGNLWVSASNGSWGRLYRLDRRGRVLGEYPMVAGLEDLTVDGEGRLWGLSESGTRKYLHWTTRFPYVFRIDPARLR